MRGLLEQSLYVLSYNTISQRENMDRTKAWEKHIYFWDRRHLLTTKERFLAFQQVLDLAKTPEFQKALKRDQRQQVANTL